MSTKSLTHGGKFPLASFSSIYMRNMDETHAQLSKLICRHDVLSYGKTRASNEIRHAPLNHMAINAVVLGTPMIVTARPESDSYLVFTSLEIPFHITIGAQCICFNPGKIVVVSPGMPFTLSAPAYASSLVLEMKQAYLHSLISREVGVEPETPVTFLHDSDASSRSDITIFQSMRLIYETINYGSPQLHHPTYLEQLEELVASSLIFNNNHSYSSHFTDKPQDLPQQVRRTIDYIHTHADAPLTLQSLATVAATTPRTLARAFRKYKNCTPMSYLQTVRLDLVHQELKRGNPQDCSVTTVASRWCFNNAGRFAQAYRERFGENPGDTLRRGKAVFPKGRTRAENPLLSSDCQ